MFMAPLSKREQMQYRPGRRPPEGINTPIESPLKDALLLVGLTTSFLVAIYFILGVLVDSAAMNLNLVKEVRYFQKDFIGSPNKQEIRLQEIVDRLWKHFPVSDQIPIRTAINKTQDLNAYMMIGGNLSVTQGLMDQLKSENELAFVVCHEIGHFFNRDVIQVMGRRLGLALALSFVGLSDQMDIIGMGAQTLSLAFDREQESGADTFALDCMNNEYGHVRGYDGFFNLVLKKQKLPKVGRKVLSFAMTHPMTEDRMKKLKKLIAEKKLSLDGELTPKK